MTTIQPHLAEIARKEVSAEYAKRREGTGFNLRYSEFEFAVEVAATVALRWAEEQTQRVCASCGANMVEVSKGLRSHAVPVCPGPEWDVCYRHEYERKEKR